MGRYKNVRCDLHAFPLHKKKYLLSLKTLLWKKKKDPRLKKSHYMSPFMFASISEISSSGRINTGA